MTDLTFIAGGSKGLGAELVSKFISQDHQVIEFSRSGSGDNHTDCDFSDTAATRQIVESTFNKAKQDQFFNINLIINTATLPPFGSIAKADPKTVKQHLAINIESTVALIQTFLKAYQHHPANKTMTYISSGAARRAIPGLGLYSASKAFFERLIDTLATEQANEQHPIDCLIINPGVMNTGMQTEIRAQNADDFPLVGMWNDWYEQGKLADPKDIAAICYQLISGEGENGGYYLAQDYLPK